MITRINPTTYRHFQEEGATLHPFNIRMGSKFYAVRTGRKTGIFSTWE